MRRLKDLIPLKSLEIHLMPIARFRARHHLCLSEVIGFEALARGPMETALADPQRLFEKAREEGLEEELDLECIRRALLQLDRLSPHLELHINIRPATLSHTKFRRRLLTEVAPAERHRVVLEVPPPELRGDKTYKRRLKNLRADGFRVALDELRGDDEDIDRLRWAGRFDYVHVGRHFMDNALTRPLDHTLGWLREVRVLTDRFNGEIVLEGIRAESVPLLGPISKQGIVLGQGHLFGPPVAALGPTARRQLREAMEYDNGA